MESAYGLAITVTMLMTTTLLTSYIAGILKHKLGACVFALLFGAIELCFSPRASPCSLTAAM